MSYIETAYMFIGIGIGLVIAFILTSFLSVNRGYMESMAILNSHAEYNSTTSEFQWINQKGL